MTTEIKKRIATFRFGVISDFVTTAHLDYGEQERLVQEKCEREWTIPGTYRTRISRGTIFDWIRRYKQGGNKIEALYPKNRSDAGKSRSIDDETAATILQIKQDAPRLTVDAVIKQAVNQLPGLAPHMLPATNVYRLLQNNGLLEKNQSPSVDRRRFEAENPNDIWQSDVMHGPKVLVENKYRKAYLLAIIDDHSRLIPNAAFCLSENLATYLKFLEEAFRRRGLPRKLYVDNGAAFKSHHLKYVAASLEIALINAKARQPQGKGKIERWFKTVRSSFLPTLSEPLTLDELNDALNRWITQSYHQRTHSSTGQSPHDRFASNMECIRVAPQNLTDHFRKTVLRKVAKDRTVTINGILFEAPVALIGERVELLYHEEKPFTVEVRHQQRSYGLIDKVDVHVNCRVRRNKDRPDDLEIHSNGSDYKSGKLFGGNNE